MNTTSDYLRLFESKKKNSLIINETPSKNIKPAIRKIFDSFNFKP